MESEERKILEWMRCSGERCPKLAVKAYREGVLALMGLIDDHFPADHTEVQLAKNNLLESLGRLKCVQMDLEERAKRA